MISRICANLIQNKNWLMLLTTIIYVLGLVAVYSNTLFCVSLFISLFFIFLVYKNYLPLKYLIIWILIFYFGAINTTFRLKDVDELLNIAPVNCEISGTVVSIPQGTSEGKSKFFFNVKEINYGGFSKTLNDEKVLVTINNLDENNIGLKIFNELTLTGRLSVPFKAGNPTQFDYGNYLRNHNAYAVFYANEVQGAASKPMLRARILQGINDYRENVISIHSKYLPTPYLEILGGIVFGDDAVSPPKEIKQSFVNSGLLHILAASGMNVAFIYGFFFWLMSLLRVPFRPKVILGMLMVAIYSLMTGLGASIIRATIMLMFVLVGKLIDRDAHSISLLSFVGLLMLIYNPMYLNDIGFQLSFIVTFGILLMSPLVVRFNHKIKDFVVGTVAIPIIAQLWVIPVQIFYFSNISMYSVFANIMSVPVLMVISSGGFVSALLSSIAPLADKICFLFDLILKPFLMLLVNISDFWGHLPNSAIQTTHPSVFQIMLYYLMLVAFTGMMYKEFREKYLKPLFIGFSAMLLFLLITLIPIKNSNLEITTFDVGNADCFLIKTPKNEYIMIDSGKNGYNGGKSQAEIIVLKYFKDKGIKNIDSIVVTHFDNDHCGGVVDLIKGVKVKKIYVNKLNHDSIAARKIYNVAKGNNTEVILSGNNREIYSKAGLSLVNYLGVSTDDDNEDSIITLLEYRGFNMLFTGDAGVKGIKAVLEYLPRNLTVLKVPHHGAHGGLDKEIVDYLNPEYSIISVGENKFGHPGIYTLELLKNTKVLRTDINNSIRIVIGKDMKILTYDIQKRKYVK